MALVIAQMFPCQSRVNTAALWTEALIGEVEQVKNILYRLFFWDNFAGKPSVMKLN